jgi:hypothetical protein
MQANQRRAVIPAVVYAVESTGDRNDSIGTQVEDCRRMAEDNEWDVVATFTDEGLSAYAGDRGPGLESATRHAAEVAAERGTIVMLVAQAHDRFAGGAGDAPGAPRSLRELWHWTRRRDVWLRTAEDDEDLRDEGSVAQIGRRAHSDSQRRSKSVSKGKRRGALRGRPPSTVPDGYRAIRWLDEDGKAHRRWERDPVRAPVFDLIFSLALDGWSDRAIVLELDRRGHRTAPIRRDRLPRPFDARRIRQTVTCPTYAGLVVYRGEVLDGVEGRWPRFLSPEDFWRIRAMRDGRINGGPARRRAGRPPLGYVLARLAVCECGSPMDCSTGHHVRADASRARRYRCRASRERPQDCGAPAVDAEVVDRAVAENLTSFLGDLSLCRDRLTRNREAERVRLAGEVERAERALVAGEAMIDRLTAEWERWLGADAADRADIALAAITRREGELERAERLLRAALDAYALAQDDEGEPTDALLDFYAGLREALSGRVSDADGDVHRLNAAMRDMFDRVELRHVPGGVAVRPFLSRAGIEIAFRALTLGEHRTAEEAERVPGIVAWHDTEPPPLREILAGADSQPSLPTLLD